ncbi:M20/M25/M40 family metallo-hydrolase [Clostridium tetani]|uniref:M20/M25/M40 family metallo-hydrolase n=1 Tax=Clostridium tetani TaxID=1513 RepID=A0ABY0ET17_CLOTA|nr:M20/M25/M40 family metallo-hydrolase [Clostridium tetani]CDI48482.1 peptidase T [Clostridium tetani 12124569]KHO40229.1 peptidase M20 [Clostridium tetani]RXI40934.1 M20/M25/M40 family metallo-hydrolase [Clostridium tetani]RXI58649.1 M20/M25/M40 family metallo-hydrolase [Clostridium tetani]RXI73362.1 M20/M25/M40 family metallo-hydrolase [Clostridium tetani]
MIKEERLLNKFLEYVQIDSESLNEKEMMETLIKDMKELGMEVSTDNTGEKVGSNGTNVYGYLKGDLDIEPILFSCHMDTVTPGNSIKPVIKDGVIQSSGDTILGGDDKSGIVSILEAIRTIKENNISHGPIEIVFTVCEEIGLKGSKNADYSKIKSRQAFILDSGGDVGKVIIKAPAQDKINVKINGKAAHAGVAPEEGISAIQVAAEAISNMKLLRIDEETTANVGIIEGGKATNIVCPELKIAAEARSLNKDKLKKQTEHMVECFNKAAEKFGVTVEIDVIHSYDPVNLDVEDEIVKTVKTACDKIGVTFEPAASGGGSDANVFNGNGIKSVNLATGMSKVHTTEEFITVENLNNTAKLVYEIILRK